MDLDVALYEKGSRWTGATASLVKRSVIKISRRRERGRSSDRYAQTVALLFFPPSEYRHVLSITGEGSGGGVERWEHAILFLSVCGVGMQTGANRR